MKRVGTWSAVGLLIMGAFGCAMPYREEPPGYSIGTPSLSPDGKTIAFAYGRQFEDNQLVLFDIPTSTLRTIEKPRHLLVKSPTFSPDGKKLAVQTYCYDACEPGEFAYQIAILDVVEGPLKFVTSGREFMRESPIFSADGQSVFYTENAIAWRDDFLARGLPWDDEQRDSALMGFSGMARVDLRSRNEERLFPSEKAPTRFSGVFPGSFSGTGSILFSAIVPHGGELESIVDDMGRKYDLLGYEYHADGRLELLPENVLHPMNSLSARTDGRRRTFISSPVNDRFNYDLFRSVDGQVSQVTSLQSHMAGASVAGNADIVVFRADATRRQNWSIWTHDFETGETRQVLTPEMLLVFFSPEIAPVHDETYQ